MTDENNDRTIKDVMNDIETLIREAGNYGYKVGEVKASFQNVSTMESKSFLVEEVFFEIVQ